MRITFYGAAHEVTGSCSLLETGDFKILVDCGMFQGSNFNEGKNHDPLPFNPAELTHVLVTHAHLDHVGRLPLLVKNGYRGHFYATAPTIELAKLIMEDALEVMGYDQAHFGLPILYQSTDIAGVMAQFKPVDYYQQLDLINAATTLHASVTFHDVGHIFGSAFIEIKAEGKKIVFSGDVGNAEVPILRDTAPLPLNLDALVCESTYGDREHESPVQRQSLIEQMVAGALQQKGVLMIPSFSLERTQELIYELNDLIDHQHKLTGVPIFLDSPLAIRALKVYQKYPQYYDERARALYDKGEDFFRFPGLTMCLTREESKRINQVSGPKVIIAGAGMMNGGRIVHHALRYLSDPHNTLLIIGYQSAGTLGRQLLDGAKSVIILKEKVPVRCHIKAIGALSAHADQNKLTRWIGAAKPALVFLNHGEPAASAALAERLRRDVDIKAIPVLPAMKVEI